MTQRRAHYHTAKGDPAYHVAGLEHWEAKARLVVALREIERLRERQRVAALLVCMLLEGEGESERTPQI